MRARDHHCERMDYAVAEERLPVWFNARFREWGIKYVDGVSSYELLFCPWDGEELPGSLRDAWFERLDRLGMEPEDPRVPEAMRSDRWWREAGL